MSDLNKAMVIGRLGADPETRYLPSGKAVTNIRVATSERWKKDGQQQERTEWHSVSMFDKLAEIAAEYLKKGAQVYIEGRIQTRKWTDKEGKDRYSTEIIADRLQMLGGKRSEGEEPRREEKAAEKPAESAAPDDFEDSIPFAWIITSLFTGLQYTAGIAPVVMV